MGEEVYPFVRSFCEEHFRQLSCNILIGGGRLKEVSTPEIRKEQSSGYKRTSNPFCGCPQSTRNLGSALPSAQRCIQTTSRLQRLIDCVIDTSNTFLKLVKDLNRGEVVSQH